MSDIAVVIDMMESWLTQKQVEARLRPNTDLRKFLCMSVVSFSSHGTIAGGTYRAGKAGAQATAQSERIRR